MLVEFGESDRDLGVYTDLYSISTSDEVMEKAASSHSQEFLKEIFKRFPSLVPKLCLFDLVFMLPLDGVSHSRGYISSPTRKAVDTYNTIIKELVNQKKCDIANHPCFRAGLPFTESMPRPQTERQLAEFLKELENQNSDSIRIAQRHLVGKIKQKSGPQLHIQTDNPGGWQTKTWSVPRGNAKDMYGGEDKDIYGSFTTFVEMLAKVAPCFLSPDGSAMVWFYAIPIAWWGRKLTKLNDHFRVDWEPLPGGSLFFGTSIRLTKEQIHFLSSYCADTIGAGYRHTQGLEEGEDEGIEETIDIFAHQVRTLAGKVSSGWLVDNAIWNHPEFAKPRELPTPKITPLPELYEAVGTVLTLWSMSIEPDHLFPQGARTQFANPPGNIHDIVNYAMYHARQSWIVGKCETLILSETEDIQSACDVVLGQKKDRIDFKSIKKECQINLGLFMKSNRLYIDKNDDKSIERYSELSGLVRLLVVHFENFLQNNDNGNIEVWVDYVQENETVTLEIYLKNLWNKDAQPNISKASHAGARSDNVLKFIENRFLKNQKVVITKPGQKAEYYCTKISISNLSWLEVMQ